MDNEETIVDGTQPVQNTSQIAEIKAAASVLIERLQFMRQAGISFGGARDLYDILGYDRLITNKQYRDRYARGGIAKRIVDALPNATWRGDVELIEDEDPKVSTTFEKTWIDLDKRLQIKAKLQRVDKLAGLSTYAVLLIGAPGPLNTELPKGKPNSLLYLTPFGGGGGPGGSATSRASAADSDATIVEFEIDPSNPRFGLPRWYQLRRTDVASPQLQVMVHWTRVIHIAEGCLDDEVYGVPALEACWNLLDDLDKVTGGGAEAFWLRANQGLQLDVDKTMNMTPAEKAALKDQADEYQHQVRRMLRTRGVQVNTLGSDVANFNSPADAILTQIAGTKSIPKRILTGSEMGELASSQDRDNWKDQVNGRQTGYAGPYIVRQLVDRLIAFGYLPTPAKGADAYDVKWAHIQTLTEAEKSTGAKDWAATKTDEGPVFNRDEIRDKWYGMEPWPKAVVDTTTGDHTSPDTGLPLAPKIDPTTGLPLKAPDKPTVSIDPLTGLPVEVDTTTGLPAHMTQDLTPVQKAKVVQKARAQKLKAAGASNLHPDWDVSASGLVRTFTFPDRRHCASFLAALFNDANSANHHPDVVTGPDAVTVTYTTHSAGDTVTELDHLAAERADRLAVTYRAAQSKLSSTQVQLPEPYASELLAFGRAISDGELAVDGRETDPHVTLKYGLHTDDPTEVSALLKNQGPIELWFGKTDVFSTPDYDVLFVEVDSPALRRLNALVSSKLDVTDTHPTYQPHATIAYLQPGEGDKYVGEYVFLARRQRTVVGDVVFSSSDHTRTEIPLGAARDTFAGAFTALEVELAEVLEAAVRANNLDVVDRILGTRHLEGEGHDFHGNQYTSRGTPPGTFDPIAEYLALYKQKGAGVARPTAVQAQKLHDAYTAIYGMLTDPDIGVQLMSTLSSGGSDPEALRSRIDTMRSGLSFPIIGGKGAPPKQFYREDRNIADITYTKPTYVPKVAATSDEKLAAALDTLLALLDDPDVAPFIAFVAEHASELRTAGGPGSGNWGHQGRPGEIGGSAPSGGGSAMDVGAGTGGGSPNIPPFQDAGGFEHTGIVWKQPVDVDGRPIPIKVKTVEEAAALVLDGKVVEVPDVQSAHTLIEKLAKDAQEAKAAGKEAKNYDLCNVSVAGSNLFCAKSLRTKDFPDGIPRVEMPQLGGHPVPGSEADKLPRNPWDKSEVDGAAVFMAHLQSIGMKTTREVVPAANLKASQREMIGPKVGKMMNDTSFDPSVNPIFVSRDDYVVDGHHRWAAVVGRDAADGKLGDATMNIVRVNAPISEVLHIANAWATKFGIEQTAGVTKQAKATGLQK